MKFLYITALLTLIGCSSTPIPKVKYDEYAKIDSAIQRSENNILKSDSVYKQSEKLISEKVKQTIGKIEQLKQEVIVAKTNNVVKTIVKTDTVYIETKKSFWGKEKVSTSIKSDISEKIDTTEN